MCSHQQSPPLFLAPFACTQRNWTLSERWRQLYMPIWGCTLALSPDPQRCEHKQIAQRRQSCRSGTAQGWKSQHFWKDASWGTTLHLSNFQWIAGLYDLNPSIGSKMHHRGRGLYSNQVCWIPPWWDQIQRFLLRWGPIHVAFRYAIDTASWVQRPVCLGCRKSEPSQVYLGSYYLSG